MVNYAVIGIGRMGVIHAWHLASRRVKHARLIAVCDIDSKKLEKFAKRYPSVSTYTDYTEMFDKEKNLQAVIVATPHYSHIPIVIDTLRNGLNVLSEKPVSVTVGEAERGIAESIKYPSLKYGIMYNQRTNPMYKKAKEILAQGKLGELKRINLIITDWYRSQNYYNQSGWRASWKGEGGGILINQCVHQLDILQWLVGVPNAITASLATKNRDITVENDVTAVMEYPDDVKCVFTASGHEIKGTNRLEIAGDKGKIIISKYKMKFYEQQKGEKEVNRTTTRGYGWCRSKVRRYRYKLFPLLRDLILGQQINIVKNFTLAVMGKKELIADGKEGINALSIINGIYLSGYRGKRVELPLDTKEYDRFLDELKEQEEKV